jgi:crossover junction endodeoxyribonuclease RusA
MEIEFPIEFLVHGTPVSLQAKRPESRSQWKQRVKDASKIAIPKDHFVSDERMSVTLFYLPQEPMQGDIDNIVKPILDALGQHIYIDDNQIERILVQKFDPDSVFSFQQPSDTFLTAIEGAKPVLYIRVSNDPEEDLA